MNLKSIVKSIFKKKLILSVLSSLLLIVLASLALTGFMLLVQTNDTTDLKASLLGSNFLMFFLNWLPVVLGMLLLFFISDQIVISVGIVGFVGALMSVINRFKMLFRQDPFMPWDIMLGGEFLGIAKSLEQKLIFGVIFILLMIILASVASFIFIKNKRMSKRFRILGFVGMIIAVFLSNKFIFSSYKINQKLFVVGNIYNQVNQYNSKGFLYSFIYAYNTNKITIPENYNKKEIQTIIQNFRSADYTDYNAVKKPHVILIMSEAFSELPLSPHLNYDGYIDPLEHYKKIKSQSASGYVVTPNVGGGTADTEFDVLTGINTRHFRGVPYSYMLVKNTFNSLASVLGQVEYSNVAIHPGYSWFYNRGNVFKNFGFEGFIDITRFNEEDFKGMYVNEIVTFDQIIDEFESHLAKDDGTPFFDFCVTIQNHGPYNDKYKVATNFTSDIPFNASDTNAMSNYFEGVIDSDRELNRLVHYLENSDEPVVLIYFGDHLPAFSQDVYSALIPEADPETIDGKTRLYKTPYIIWENKAAAKILPDGKALADGKVISTHYLGAMVLEYLGYDDLDPFFQYVNHLREQYPIIFESQYFTKDGVLHNAEEQNNEDLDLYRKWEYYKIFDE